jgi:hypothetical protein
LVTRSYIKIYGPSILEAIRALERISVEIPEVSIMNIVAWREIAGRIARELSKGSPGLITTMAELAINYFDASSISLSAERSKSIFSKSGESLGEYDFFFEWFRKPDKEQIYKLIEKVDEELADLGCRYTITTK